MNLLYQTLFPASLLPWCIISLFYFIHGYFFAFLMTAFHLGTHAMVILHKPWKMDIVKWNRLLHLQRLALWIIYAFRNQWNQHGLSLFIFIMIGLNLKLMRTATKLYSPIIHLLCVLTFCSTASLFQFIISLGALGMYFFMMQPIAIQWETQVSIENYFLARMGYNYISAIAEWSVSDMNVISLPFIVFVCIIFNTCVYYNVPRDTKKQDEWYVPKDLPEGYPYPLNIKDANEQCNITRKLFKSHDC